jgi:hypothetical protein
MNHCINCGNNIPDEVKTCGEAGFGDGCGKKLATMPKDYQEVEKIVDEYKSLFHYTYDQVDENLTTTNEKYLRQALTTYGNAREEEIIKIAEGKKKEIDLHPETNADYLEFKNDFGYNQALTDLIEAIKK